MRIITIASSKGGVGKTTITANLGAALKSEFGRKVVLIDGNMMNANLGLHFGINYSVSTLLDVLKRKEKISEAIFTHSSGVSIIPSPLDLNITRVDLKKIKSIFKDLRDSYEILLIDSAPGIGMESMSAIGIADEVIVSTTPDLPSVLGCLKSIEIAEKLGKVVTGIVLNRVEKKEYEVTKNEIESLCESKVIAMIPEDKNIPKSIIFQQPVVFHRPFSRSSIEIKKLAAQLIGEKYSGPGFFAKLKNFFV